MPEVADFFLAGECTDPGYRNVRDLAHHEDERVFIEAEWRRHAPFADAHSREDAKNPFNERSWEMYLGVTLPGRGLSLVRPAGSAGPEFHIVSHAARTWIEAVAPGPGDGPDRVPEPEPNVVNAVPVEKILLRFTNALDVKRKKYAEDRRKGIVSATDAYVLAINSRRIPHAPFGNTLPYFVQAFLPFGPFAVAIDRHSHEIVDSHYQFRDSVRKLGGSSASTTAFLDPAFSFCSAVLHSAVDCANRPDELGRDFTLLHNPNASCPVDPSVFSWARQWKFVKDRLVELA